MQISHALQWLKQSPARKWGAALILLWVAATLLAALVWRLDDDYFFSSSVLPILVLGVPVAALSIAGAGFLIGAKRLISLIAGLSLTFLGYMQITEYFANRESRNRAIELNAISNSLAGDDVFLEATSRARERRGLPQIPAQLQAETHVGNNPFLSDTKEKTPGQLAPTKAQALEVQ